jgi:hypothetical protein
MKEKIKSDPNILRDLDVLEYKLNKLKSFTEKFGLNEAELKNKVCSEIPQTGGKKKTSKKTSKKSSKKALKKSSKKISKKTSKKIL